MLVLLEKRETGGSRNWPSAGTVAEDWAKMCVLQRFRGLCPQNPNDRPQAAEILV